MAETSGLLRSGKYAGKTALSEGESRRVGNDSGASLAMEVSSVSNVGGKD
jgi:hypothetical protein